MATTLEVYRCEKTKATVEVIKTHGIQPEGNHPKDKHTLTYHGKTLECITPETAEGAAEKHLPVASFEGDRLVVKVGDVMHPMTSEHLIEWVAVVYDNFVQHGTLCSEEAPQISFHVGNASDIEVYSYCNLHGLWKTVAKR